ncbi:MAG: OmpA family protein [bacterium]|nr:OmpA family protein [bacterium]
MPDEKQKVFFSRLAVLLLTGFALLAPGPDLRAADDDPVAGVAVLEGEVYYWPFPAGETQALENNLVILERDARIISLPAGIQFQPQARDIVPGSLPVLDKLGEVLLANPDLIVLITVQAEKTAKPENALSLAGERADQIKDYLVAKEINPSRMATRDGAPAAKDKQAEGPGREGEPPVAIVITEQDKDLNPRWMKLKTNTDFYVNDEIKTGTGKVKILFPSGVIMSLSPHAYLKIIDGSRVKLFRGNILADAGKLQDDQEFQIETVNARISARGSTGFLNFINGINTIISLKGELSVSGKPEPGESLRLAQGKRIVIQAGHPPGKPEAVSPRESENIINEFKLNNFDFSQSLFDEKIRKKLNQVQPPASPAGTQPTTP